MQINLCDIKSQNILVDDSCITRISDFRMAKLLKLEQTWTSAGIRRTIGYFAPEWFKNSTITAKVDVYSFKVLLLEIVCCGKNLDWDYGLETEVWPALTKEECWRERRVDLLVEEDEEAKMDKERLERFVMVGTFCVQEKSWLRPTMKKVMHMVEGDVEVDVPPNLR